MILTLNITRQCSSITLPIENEIAIAIVSLHMPSTLSHHALIALATLLRHPHRDHPPRSRSQQYLEVCVPLPPAASLPRQM